jgi:hypothetical protein
MYACFQEFEEITKAYATVVGSIEQFDGDYDNLGFYQSNGCCFYFINRKILYGYVYEIS